MATYRGINIYDQSKEKLSLLKLPGELSTNDFRQLIAIGEDKFLAGIMGGFAIIDTNGNPSLIIILFKKGLQTLY